MPLQSISKIESLEHYGKLSEFLDITNMQFEPALKSIKSVPYHASSVLQTKIIDVAPIEIEAPLQIAYNRMLNHEGYKQAHYFSLAEYFNLKPVSFVQAFSPSIYVNARRQRVFLTRKSLLERLRVETDLDTRFRLQAYLEDLRFSDLHYTSRDFLHYRFWFFDLDYEYYIKVEDVLDMLKEVGLFPYVNALVQTSPTKYHLYIKSEMVATESHVSNWPKPLSRYERKLINNPEYLQKLNLEKPNKTGSDWFMVGRRGTPGVDRLNEVPTPIPVDAKLRNGLYYGDTDVYKDYIATWKEIAHVLGSDPRVFDETRNAQLVGYVNPKNGYRANVVYANKDAPVLTTRTGKTTIHDNIKKFTLNYDPFYIPLEDNKITIQERIQKEQKIEHKVEQKVDSQEQEQVSTVHEIEFKPEKLKKSVGKIPNSPEEYCRMYGLMDEVIWDMDITGRCNDMLLLFTRFAHRHIDLKNEKQQKLYFNSVVNKYFDVRRSKGLATVRGKKKLFRDFRSLCKHDAMSMPHLKLKRTQTEVESVQKMRQLFEDQLRQMLGDNHPVLKKKKEIRIRETICNYAFNFSKSEKIGNICNFIFQIPSAILNKFHAYKKSLNFYASLGLYSIGDSYVPPKKKGTLIIRGECKQHVLTLNLVKDDKTMVPIEKINVVCNDLIEEKEKIEKIEKVEVKKKIRTIEEMDEDVHKEWNAKIAGLLALGKDIERQRIEDINRTRKYDLVLIEELKTKKQELKEILNELHAKIKIKEEKHREVLLLMREIDDDISYLWQYAGVLNRDNMTDQYKKLLPPDIRELYEIPLKMQKEELKYVPIIEALVTRIRYLKNTVTYDPLDDYSELTKTTSPHHGVKSMLASLKD